MEDDREKKIEAGREKLTAYKKKKQNRTLQSSGSSSASQSDSSLSLSLNLLPDNGKHESAEVDPLSDSSAISEHLNSNSDSIENDRSYQEIEISNIPSNNFSLMLQNLPSDEDVERISQEVKPTSLNSSSNSLSGLNKSDSIDTNVQGILDEILRSDQFKSDSEHTLLKNNESNENSFNMFDGVNLNDSLIDDFKANITQKEDIVDGSANKSNVSLPSIDKTEDTSTSKRVVEPLNTGTACPELESLREVTSSNQSTMSLNTSTTDYQLYYNEFQNKVIEYQNAMSYRDSIIQKLTEALQQSVTNRDQLQQQCEYFSKEIVALQKQLPESFTIINQCKCDNMESKVKSDAAMESVIKDNLIAQEKGDDKTVLNFETQCSQLEETLSVSQIHIFNRLKDSINLHIEKKGLECECDHKEQLKILEDKLESEKTDHEVETARLRELLANIKCDSIDIVSLRQELEAKHAKEVEELRMYFEKKCADLEKHYSEEVFSQQSRKMSASSSCSEGSDYIFSNSYPRAGPGGDSGQVFVDISKVDTTKRNLDGLTRDDLLKLKSDLISITNYLEKYNMENISKEDLATLKAELVQYDLGSLLKYDISVLKTEMQNKYHAELEILREDYENRIDCLNVENDSRMQNMERKYADQIESLKFDLDEALRSVDVNVSTAVQEVASSGEYELAEVVQSYERRLQEQVTLAKIDIINALEHQIQILAASTAEDAEWPSELLQLRNQFTKQYEKQITELKEKHQEEISRLKEENLRKLNGALERARRRSSKDSESLSQSDMDIIKERDNLKKTTSVLRHLIGELMKYFSECEEELNNTLVEELLKQGFDKNLTELEVELNLNESSNSTSSDTFSINKKRVHLTPKFEELMATIDSSIPSSLDSNISIDLKNELGACLQRLRADANAVLALSTNIKQTEENKIDTTKENLEITLNTGSDSLQERISTLTRQLLEENQIKNDLILKLDEARGFVGSLEAERSNLDLQVEQLVAKQKVLETDLGKAREKIAELIENGHKEIVSEGYGENSKSGSHNLGECIASLAELQERARGMVAECASNGDHPLLQLVEELCREGDRITEEAKHDHEDLQQQIEAADKKLRATCHFLEEQAAEREQERDEAQKEIASLHEQLRERDRDRASCERINTEVEHLEQQIREMSKTIEQNEIRQNEIEAEKKEAIEKIYVLRDIIRDLEQQVEIKTESEIELRTLVTQLEELIKHQNKSNEELSQRLGTLKDISDAEQLQEHVEQLQDEIQRLRMNNEFAGSEGALKQIRTQLNEFEVNIDKCTKDLEALHSTVSNTSCSSPSEEMSIRDQIRPRSPSVLEECDVPLQQLARLKEKLIKHSRAEDAAVKRIRDLEMQLHGLKHDFEEVQNERDVLQDQVSEHMVLISSLQIRLDDQRLRAEQVQKQTNTSLEMRIYDLENEIRNLMDTITARDKTIRQLNKTVEETKKRLEDQDKELAEKQEDKIIIDLQREITKLHAENASLVAKINSDAQNAQVLPNLVDNIISDKNKDIELLRDRLDKTQSELNMYLSLNLDYEQLKALSKLQSSERAFSDILSLIDLDAPDKMRKSEKVVESLNDSISIAPYKRAANETTLLGSSVGRFEPEISSIERVTEPNINYSVMAPLSKPNSTEIHKSSEKRVHFEDTLSIEKLQKQIEDLKHELSVKNDAIVEYLEQLKILTDLETNIDKLQQKLDFTESALQKTTETFEKEQNILKETEKELRIELAEKKMHLTDKEKQLDSALKDSTRKDQMYINLAKEKRQLEIALNEIQENKDQYKEFNNIMEENNKELNNLKTQLAEFENSVGKVKSLESELNAKKGELKVLQETFLQLQEEADSKSSELKQKLAEKDEMNMKLEKDLKNKESQLALLSNEIQTLKEAIETKDDEISALQKRLQDEGKKSVPELEARIKELKNVIVDRETEIEILNEDANRYQDDILKLGNKLKTVKSSLENEHELKLAKSMRDLAATNLQLEKLSTELEDTNREIKHLQELVDKKDKIINQMSEDSKTLHINLETIQSKMQESGNIVDLKRKLEDEQRLNAVLKTELITLRNMIAHNEEKQPVDMTTSIEEITGAVRKQLDYSAHLDSNILSALHTGNYDNLGSLIDSTDIDLLKQNLSKERFLSADLTKTKEVLQKQCTESEAKFECEREKVQQLQALLENEKQNSNAIQLEDANMLEQLRIRLEAALENETEFEKLLEKEKQVRQELELQVLHLKQNYSDNSKTDFTEYKSLPNLELRELMKLRKDVQSFQEENTKLKADIKSLKKVRSELEAKVKYTKDMLELKNEEVKNQEKRISEIKEVEGNTKEKWISCRNELMEKVRELDNTRILIGEMEQDGHNMRAEINNLNEYLKKAKEEEKKLLENLNEVQMHSIVPEKFLNKMTELNNLVKEHMKDNKQLTETLNKLTVERQILQDRVKELEELNNIKMPFDDPVARANHLFARYLRADSYRKALIWQKKYLITLLASYQTYPLFAHKPPLSPCNFASTSAKSKGKNRFRAVVVTVISVLRMQFLVQRWHSGIRGIGMHYNKVPKSTATRTFPHSTVLFQVGQPISAQNFPSSSNLNRSLSQTNVPNHLFPNVRSTHGLRHRMDVPESSTSSRRPITPPNNRIQLESWSGVTPPTKEQDAGRRVPRGAEERFGASHTGAPLQTPALLSQYIERFDQIQNRLGMALDKSAM